MTTYKNHLITEHGGAINGFRSQITLFPEDSLGIIILTNSADHKMTSYLQFEIADLFLNLNKTQWHERVFERTKKQFKNHNVSNTTNTIKENIKLSNSLNNYVGAFEHPAYGVIEIKEISEKLFFTYKLFNEAIIHIGFNKFETSNHEQLGTYTITFKTNSSKNIDSIVLDFEGISETFIRK